LLGGDAHPRKLICDNCVIKLFEERDRLFQLLTGRQMRRFPCAACLSAVVDQRFVVTLRLCEDFDLLLTKNLPVETQQFMKLLRREREERRKQCL
jgi:hypothetical protein